MTEPWKVIICKNPKCLVFAYDRFGKVKEEAKLKPNVDVETFTQFTCPRCGESETWGITKRKAQEALYEWLGGMEDLWQRS